MSLRGVRLTLQARSARNYSYVTTEGGAGYTYIWAHGRAAAMQREVMVHPAQRDRVPRILAAGRQAGCTWTADRRGRIPLARLAVEKYLLCV